MTFSIPRARHYLKNFELKKLFIEELGWDQNDVTISVSVDGQNYTLDSFVQKRGVQIFRCNPDAKGKIPDYPTRQKIERQVTRSAYEHVVIFCDAQQTVQIWQWVARGAGRPVAYREHPYHPMTQSGDALIQKLSQIVIPLDEEEALDLRGTVHKLKGAFDRDRITKKFYGQFEKEHTAFLKFIKGISEQGDRAWYASLMLNRLMFVYFIQKKGFLDDDPNYLVNRLKAVQTRKGKGQFLTFYRYFLLALFHEGFSKQEKDRHLDADHKEILGYVPYVNGGLFELHDLEARHPDIDVPDEAFEKLLAFFDQYDWTLETHIQNDDDKVATSKTERDEIDPDVLGYIFEKYINNKEMGAYYTKEDITDYIGKNTILPYLFDTVRKNCAVAFPPDAALWRLLKDDPDRYLYTAMRHGVIDADGEVIPLLPKIAEGIQDVKQRSTWNQLADSPYALPTETWREHVARRQRCLDLRNRLLSGEVHEINDLITFNLDIRQFAEDAIITCEGPELLRAFYQALSKVTVLDPTCGSGAFLFAALNILEPLYEACLDRMQAFIGDLAQSGKRHSPKKFEDFHKVLADVDKHPNRMYFILKSIIVQNLYGVDIMDEAIEICKLRLFLKLVAQVDKVKQLEPLPDIDFNIRAGNTLIGYTTLEQIRKAANTDQGGKQGLLGFTEKQDDIAAIEEKAEDVNRAFQRFHQMQVDYDMEAKDFAKAKKDLRGRLGDLTCKLDCYLAGEYGVDPPKIKKFEAWLASHQPFHWFAEFYGIMSNGGFDVIIGNPPYLQKSQISGKYSVHGYKTHECRDIYAWVVERCFNICNRISGIGLIVPVSIASSGNFNSLRTLVKEASSGIWMSHYANRPGQLFSGAQNRLTILLCTSNTSASQSFSTKYHRWIARAGEREALFSVLNYVKLHNEWDSFFGFYPKVGSTEALIVINKILTQTSIRDFLSVSGCKKIYWVRVPGYFCQFFLEPPRLKPEGGGPWQVRGELNSITIDSDQTQKILHTILNSSTYLQFFVCFTDGRHINPSDVKLYPLSVDRIPAEIKVRLENESMLLKKEMEENTSLWRKSGFLIESVDSVSVKPRLDSIDTIFAEYYGFTDEELDFIINYDIKFRMGIDQGEDES